MKKYLLFATAFVALASCSDDTFVGESNSPNANENYGGAINFGLSMQKMTRGDIYGSEAAKLLNNNFYVMGTKGTEPTNSPTTTVVFDNYLVHYTPNTADTKPSNTANWEYVGVVPGAAPTANYVKLSAASIGAQTIKYWDYSQPQYDFLAFSTGSHKAVSSTSPSTGEIGVTAMKYGEALKSNGVAYTFYIPDANAIKQAYITDITEVVKANYGKEVQLKFKSLGSKVRIALYETVPGYAVTDVNFYQVDGTTDFTETKSTTAVLITNDKTKGIPTKGTIEVYFPHVGVNNSPDATSPNTSKADYNKAATKVTTTAPSSPSELVMYYGFNTLSNFASTKEGYEADGSYLGRTLPTATFAGSSDAQYYQTVFPVSTGYALTLRVDYTLVSTDGSGETIHVYGAKAVVPSTYTTWLPNYAYTYIFKISDNTNGWTDTGATKAGLFPITFDAVVAEATDATGQQKTITTVSTPSIITYQQNHNTEKDEYSIATGKNIYVQVMHNEDTDPHLVGCGSSCTYPKLNATSPYTASLLYAISDADATEAAVMDALQKRITALNVDNITGRNGITLTKNTNIDNTVTKIINGPDDNPIEKIDGSDIVAGQVAKIATSSLSKGTYAYVYDYTTSEKKKIEEFQPIDLSSGKVGATDDGKSYYSIAKSDLFAIVNAVPLVASNFTTGNEKNTDTDFYNYIYFSVTTNGTGTKTLSYVSVAGKETLPAGLLKYAKSSITTTVTSGSTGDDTANFYFEKYITNDGKYAVKVIKIDD